MKAEAEANADSDKQAKERIEKLNQADSMIFQTEKNLKEFGDKLPADKKAPIEAALGKLKEAHQKQDIEAIDAAMNELNTVVQAASQDMYNAGAGQQAGNAQQGNPTGNEQQQKSGDDVTDVDFEEVK